MYGIQSFVPKKGEGDIYIGLLTCIVYLWEDTQRRHVRLYSTENTYSGSYFTAVGEDLTDVLLGVAGPAKQRHEVRYHRGILEVKGRRAQQPGT